MTVHKVNRLSCLAQGRPLFVGPSTFAPPTTSRTVHFYPFRPFTLNHTQKMSIYCKNKKKYCTK